MTAACCSSVVSDGFFRVSFVYAGRKFSSCGSQKGPVLNLKDRQPLLYQGHGGSVTLVKISVHLVIIPFEVEQYHDHAGPPDASKVLPEAHFALKSAMITMSPLANPSKINTHKKHLSLLHLSSPLIRGNITLTGISQLKFCGKPVRTS